MPNQIHVQFLDTENKIQFPPVDLPLERLPESFESETTMHFGKDDYLVIEARPPAAAEFAATGNLTLLLKKIEKVTLAPTEQILFSLPTINDEIPGIAENSTKLSKQTIELHEDDWRQIEFISSARRKEIETEFADIRAVHEKYSLGAGFKKVHIRSLIPAPLAGVKLTLADLAAALGPRAAQLDGVSYHGVAGIVRDSFAFRLLSAIELYGQAHGGHITFLCIQNKSANNLGPADLDPLAKLAADHNLTLVDWLTCQAILPTPEAYRAYFTH